MSKLTTTNDLFTNGGGEEGQNLWLMDRPYGNMGVPIFFGGWSRDVVRGRVVRILKGEKTP